MYHLGLMFLGLCAAYLCAATMIIDTHVDRHDEPAPAGSAREVLAYIAQEPAEPRHDVVFHTFSSNPIVLSHSHSPLHAKDVVVTGPGALHFSPGSVANYSSLSITEGAEVALHSSGHLPANSGPVTFSGNGTLRALAAINSLGHRFVLSSESTGTLDTQDFHIASHGTITGTGNLKKSGRGTLFLTGANHHTGRTIISQGILQIGSTTALSPNSDLFLENAAGTELDLNGFHGTVQSLSGGGPSGGDVVLKEGTLTLAGRASTTFSGALKGNGGLIKQGEGTFVLQGTCNTYSGATEIKEGKMQAGASGVFSKSSAVVLQNASTAVLDLNDFHNAIHSLSGSGEVVLGKGTLTLEGNASTSFAGKIHGTGGLKKRGNGIFTLESSLNTYGGTTVIHEGALRAGALHAFSHFSDVVLENTTGAVLDLNDFHNTVRSLSGGGEMGGDVMLGEGTLTLAGHINTAFAGAIKGNGGLTKEGDATFTLQGRSNTYRGSTTIRGGCIRAGASETFSPSSAVVLENKNGAVLDLNSFHNTIQSLSGGGENGGDVFLGSGTLTLAGHESTTFSGALKGTGGLIKQGSGVFTLQGNCNTYSGTTTIVEGQVKAGFADAFPPFSAIVLHDAPGVILDLNDFHNAIGSLSGGGANGGNVCLGSGTLTVGGDHTNTVYAGVVSGSGDFVKTGSGMLTLTGENTFTGATTLRGGILEIRSQNCLLNTSRIVFSENSTLKLGFAGASLVLPIAIDEGIIATFDTNGFDLEIPGVLGGGSFSLEKTSSGVMTLSGTNTYSGPTKILRETLRAGSMDGFSKNSHFSLSHVEEAVLDLNNFDSTIGSLAGGGRVFLGSATLTTGGDHMSTSYEGSIVGDGGVIKQGSGHFSLTGPNHYTGPTIINEGRLSVDGSIASHAMVNPGAILGGTGTVQGNVNVLGGVVRPGNSIGTLHIAGDYFLDSSSVTEIELGPSASSLLDINGMAHLAGTLRIVPNAGTYTESTYTILTAAGGLSGTSFDVFTATDIPGFTYSLSYHPSSVALSLILSPINTSTLSGNNLIIGAYLNDMIEKVDGLDVILPKLSVLSPQNLDAALRSISPARNAFAAYSVQNSACSLLQISTEHLANQRLLHFLPNKPSAPLACEGPFDEVDLVAVASSQIPYGRSAILAKQQTSWAFWIEGIGDFSHCEAQHQAPGFNAMTGGGILGLDYYGFANMPMGICFGGSASSIDDRENAGEGSVNTYFTLLYGGYYLGNWYFDFGGLTGYFTCENRRNISFPGFYEKARSDHHGWEAAPYFSSGYDLKFGWLTVEPFARGDWIAVWQQGFSEKGAGVLDMSQSSSFSSMLRIEAGVRFYQMLNGDWGICILKESLSDVLKQPLNTGAVEAALVGAPSGFMVKSFTDLQNLFSPGVQIFARSPSGGLLSLSYQGEFGSGYRSNAVTLELGAFF